MEGAKIDFKFVFYNLKKEDQKTLKIRCGDSKDKVFREWMMEGRRGIMEYLSVYSFTPSTQLLTLVNYRTTKNNTDFRTDLEEKRWEFIDFESEIQFSSRAKREYSLFRSDILNNRS